MPVHRLHAQHNSEIDVRQQIQLKREHYSHFLDVHHCLRDTHHFQVQKHEQSEKDHVDYYSPGRAGGSVEMELCVKLIQTMPAELELASTTLHELTATLVDDVHFTPRARLSEHYFVKRSENRQVSVVKVPELSKKARLASCRQHPRILANRTRCLLLAGVIFYEAIARAF